MSAQTRNSTLVGITGYVEAYYVYDFGNPEDHTRPPFFYSHNRHNEFNLNLGFIRAAVNDSNYRAAIALMAGSYANANLSAEPGVFKNIFEASAGVKLARRNNVWFDMGIFPSHIGFESATGKDCWNLTRSILADNSPYYECGARLTWNSSNEKWNFGLFALNGWQRIQRVAGNSLLSFGTQCQYKPSGMLTLNSSTFIGTEQPDSVRTMRYFHNFYLQVQATSRLGLIFGFDTGVEQKSKGSSAYNCWWSPVVVARYALNAKAAVAVRVEHYNDKNEAILSTGSPNGFQVTGYSANFDYAFSPSVLWRLEARGLYSADKIFLAGTVPVHDNYFFGTSLAVSF